MKNKSFGIHLIQSKFENFNSLLGHNGAGKTTTISILTGILEADSGDIYCKLSLKIILSPFIH